MRLISTVFLVLFVATSLVGQGGHDNPFEIKDRLPPKETKTERTAAPNPRNDNPFEIVAAPIEGTGNSKYDSTEFINQGPLLIRRNNEPAVLDARGRTLGIHVSLLFITAILWIFFRPLLAQAYLAIFNDGILSQLYRKRTGGGRYLVFLLSYLLFFLAGGFYAYLIGQAFELFPSDQPWQYWIYLTAWLLAILAAKHLLLRFLGWLFPVQPEMGKYNFTIMIFGIVTGMVLVPINLLISYAPASSTLTIAWISLVLLGGIYFIRSARAILIGSRFLNRQLLHFLLYICAVEITPLFILYRYLGG